MDLILLQPGNPDLLAGAATWNNGSSLLDGKQFANQEMGQCIELVSMHHGIRMTGGAGAHGADTPLITELTFVKYVDQASVRFYGCCLRAVPIGKGKDQLTTIYLARNSGDATASIMTLMLRDAIITDIQLQSHPDDMPTEQFTLNFTEILWRYTAQHTDTTAGSAITSGWSRLHNRPITAFS